MGQLTLLDSLDAPGSGPAGLAWDGRYLWNADFVDGRIRRIDPDTGGSDVQLICPGNLSGLTWDGLSLWQSLHDVGRLHRINPQTNDFDQTLLLAEHGWLAGVAWDGQRLWTVSQQKGQLMMLDRESGDLLRSLPAPIAAGDLDFHNGSLWLGFAYPMSFDERYEQFNWEGDEQHFALVRLDPTDGQELARYELEFVPMGLAWAGENLWLSHVSGRKIFRARVS